MILRSIRLASLLESCPLDYRNLVTTRSPTVVDRFLRTLLLPLTIPYWVGAQTKNWLYNFGIKKSYKSGLPTISIGNLSVGGTGKSPFVAWVAKYLRSTDQRVAILSRGYGQLADGQNDEALELELLLPDVPHLQHWDRIASAKLADEELDMQWLVLDDAFQHRRISRDLDIVLIDATDPPGARQVLPRGLFREPFTSLRRAHLVAVTRANHARPAELDELVKRIKRTAPQADLICCDHVPLDLYQHPSRTRELSELNGCKVIAFCGIGNSNAFFELVASLGADIVERVVWPDHHAYSAEDVHALQEKVASREHIDFVICTMKDLVKLQVANLSGKPLVALRISMAFQEEGESVVKQRIDELASSFELQ